MAAGTFTDLSARAGDIGLEVRSAVVAEAPELLPCLEFGDPELRRFALHVLGGCAKSLGADRPLVANAVLEVFENEIVGAVAADALRALTLEDEAVFADRIAEALTEPDPRIRLAGMLCAPETGLVHELAERAELVNEAGRLAARFAEDTFSPLPLLGTPHQRAQRAFRALQAEYRDSW